MEYPIIKSIDNVSSGSAMIISQAFENASGEELRKVLETLLSRDYSDNTRDACIRDIREFVIWYEKASGEGFLFKRVIERDIMDFRDSLRKLERTVATVNRKLVSLRIFFDTAIELEYITKNPSKKVKQLASQGLSPKGLTKQEMRRFLKEVEIRGNLRDKVVIFLMLYSGLRVSEVVKLERKDILISERSGYVNVLDSKGRKSRKVPLPLLVREVLSEYLQEQLIKYREETSSGPVIIGQRGPLSEIAVNKMFEKYVRTSGITCSPHSLRHTFAYSYLEVNPSDIVGLSQILGHSDINTTAIYTQNRLENLQERVENMGS